METSFVYMFLTETSSTIGLVMVFGVLLAKLTIKNAKLISIFLNNLKYPTIFLNKLDISSQDSK